MAILAADFQFTGRVEVQNLEKVSLGNRKTHIHQKFQVSKMEVPHLINLIAGYFGGGETALHKPYIHTAYIGEDSSILGTKKMFGDIIYAPQV